MQRQPNNAVLKSVTVVISLIVAASIWLERPVQLRQQLEGMYEQSMDLSEAGKDDEAIAIARRAVQLAETRLGSKDFQLARALTILAGVLKSPVEAEPLLNRAVAFAEETLGPEHLDLASLLISHVFVRRFDVSAEPQIKRAIAIREKALGREHPDVGKALALLQGFYATNGREDEALNQRLRAFPTAGRRQS